MDIFRVSFIGHRVVDEYRQVEEELDEVIELLHRKYGFIDFNVGRNGEFDDLATQAVRRFRREWEEWCELTEALYSFLLYCRKVNLRERISEEFADYVAYILSICY